MWVNYSWKINFDNVLYIPQLLKYNNYTLSFKTSLCAIQDISSRSLIRANELKNGLYYFRDMEPTKINKVTTNESKELRHTRLGILHIQLLISCLMYLKLKIILSVIFFVLNKHVNLFVSSNKASHIFSLIHLDVWGPYKVPTLGDAKYFLIILDFSCVV